MSEGVRQAVKLTSDRVHLLTREITNSHVDVGSRVSRSRLGLACGATPDDLPSPLSPSPLSSIGSDQVHVCFWRYMCV